MTYIISKYIFDYQANYWSNVNLWIINVIIISLESLLIKNDIYWYNILFIFNKLINKDIFYMIKLILISNLILLNKHFL